MAPQINSILGVILLIFGLGAVLIMLELRGNPKDRPFNITLMFIHRVFGYVFVSILLYMTIVMIKKVGTYQEPLTPRIVFHVIMGITIIPIVVLKILTVRRYKRLSSDLISLGKTIFLIAFVMNTLTAGYYFLHKSDIRYISLTEFDEEMLDENFGQMIVHSKCNKCHTLERVFRAFKSEEGWTKTVNRMAVLDVPNIDDFDIKQIIHFMLKQQERRQTLRDSAVINSTRSKGVSRSKAF